MGSKSITRNWVLGLAAGVALLVGCSSDSEEDNNPNAESTAGSAGSAMGDDQTASGEDEVDASDRTIRPSAACAGGAISDQGPKDFMLSDGQMGEYIVTVPRDYDGTTPMPLMFAFHGANNRPSDCIAANCGGVRMAVE